MKIDELEFENHPVGMNGMRAKAEFNNGYSASVVTGSMFYTSLSKPYEIAVMKDDALCYTTPLTDDVLGYLDEEAANKVLADIEALSSDSE